MTPDDPTDRPRQRGALALVGLVVAVAAATVAELGAMGAGRVATWTVCVVLAGAVAAMVQGGLVRPLTRSLRAERDAAAEARAARDDAVARYRFVEQFESALSTADTETAVLTLVGRAVTALAPERVGELLLSPVDQPVVSWSVHISADGLGTPVGLDPATVCRALVAGPSVSTPTGDDIDACPHLGPDDRSGSSCCVALPLNGGHLGVIHLTGPLGDELPAEDRAAVEMVARLAGGRLTALRNRATIVDATATGVDRVVTDELTGLMDHASVMRSVRSLVGHLTPFSIALFDLDRFAAFNEEHGTETGDVVLRVVAEALDATLRPGDVIGRSQSDKFIAVFPRCTPADARAAMERVREATVLQLASSGLPMITASVGVAESVSAGSLDELLESAEIAMLVAKHEGGNRVRLATFDEVTGTRDGAGS